MRYYEFALSCIKWLDYVPCEKDKDFFPEIDEDLKRYLTPHNDSNVILNDGEDMRD